MQINNTSSTGKTSHQPTVHSSGEYPLSSETKPSSLDSYRYICAWHSYFCLLLYKVLLMFVPHSVGQEMASETSVVSPDEDKDFKVVQQFLQRRGSSSFTLADVHRWVAICDSVIDLALKFPAGTHQHGKPVCSNLLVIVCLSLARISLASNECFTV